MRGIFTGKGKMDMKKNAEGAFSPTEEDEI